jgi:hypothetical protein
MPLGFPGGIFHAGILYDVVPGAWNLTRNDVTVPDGTVLFFGTSLQSDG